MADPAPVQLLPDLVLEEIFVRLPPRNFHRCRCLSRAWAATLSSSDVIDHHLCLRGKIRLDYDDLMSGLLLDCCIDDYDDDAYRLAMNISEEKESDITTEKVETAGEDGDGDGDGKTVSDWREEYRTRGYVEVDQDYYIRREEMEATVAREWANMESSKAEIRVDDYDSDDDDDEWETVSESDHVDYGAGTIPYGALHPRIRQPFLEEDPSLDCIGGQGGTEGHDGIKPIRGREKTEEEVDQEIIAFLRRLRDMDPQPQFLREFDTYRCPWPIPQQGQDEMEALLEEEVGQEDGEVDEESDAINP